MPKQSNSRRKNNKAEEKEYLDQLQRESWNLELIISGLAIFGLAAAYSFYDGMEYLSKYTSDSFVGGLIIAGVVISMFCGTIIFVNLIIHFLLRGLWIGAVGLRSVSGDINFYQLRFSRPFNRFLRRRIKSFDDYIIGLDRICSVIFSFSFLLVLLLIGFFIYWAVLILGLFGINEVIGLLGFDLSSYLIAAIVITYIFLGLVYLLDFLSLGRIKRIRWLSKFYYPVYRFFGFVTIARVYRPLYYNFIDDKFGRKMVLVAIPYIALIFLGISMNYQGGPFYDRDYFHTYELFEGSFSQEEYYENLRDDDDESIHPYLLEKDAISGPVNKLSIFILPDYADAIEYKYPEAERLNETVINSELVIGFNQADRHTHGDEEIQVENYLDYFKSLFEVSLNGRQLNLDDAVLFDSKDYPFPKLVKYLSLNEESPGLQQLEITRYAYTSRGDSLKPETRVIPFFYQPE